MNIGIAYTEPDRQFWVRIEVPEGSTLQNAIEWSGLLERFPHVDLNTQKVGIFGRFAKLDTPIKEGDRVEVYRPITADPQVAHRRLVLAEVPPQVQ
jgi:putative ubiquitin-RnfH superfamily antitoxin RatB of RatAB toxin-antitoxin module